MNSGLKVVGWAWLLLACGSGDAADSTRDDPRARMDTAPPSSDVRTTTATRSGSNPPTVVFLGTSLTAGLGLDPDQAYPALVAGKLDSAGLRYQVVNAGVSGETSAGALQRIGWVLRRVPVDVLVLETGANDGLRGLDVGGTRANIQAIIDSVRARRPQAQIALVQMEAPPNLGLEYTSRFRAMYPTLARANRIPLIPFLLEGVAGEEDLNQGDAIHPNSEGAKRVADNVWRALHPILVAHAARTAPRAP